jgi:hypothetical protein
MDTDQVKSHTQYHVFMLLAALAIITVSCNPSSAALPSPAGTQDLRPSAMASSTPTSLPAKTSPSIPTLDSSTPAPPSGEWAAYTYRNSGLSFSYPANWFISLDEEYNRVEILNAPTGSVAAIKHSEGGYTEFVKIIVDLNPTDIPRSQTFETYVNDTINQPNWAAGIISVEWIPALRQGYPAVRVISSGPGEWTHYFVANAGHVMHVTTDYLPDRRAELALVVEEVVNTLMFP